MKIAILGWGSLIWRPGTLPLATEWRKPGPSLPLEFSRISRSRGGALTLVIDPVHGALVPTRFAASSRSNLEHAIQDLRSREHTEDENVGYVDLEGECLNCRAQPEAAPTIGQWAARNGFDAVVWTDLPSNFEQHAGTFSVVEGIRYLMGLREPNSGMARQYLLRAPLEIVTPLRERLWVHPWLWS
jgi:hypothetical protein